MKNTAEVGVMGVERTVLHVDDDPAFEFCVFKPLTDFEPLLDVIDRAFWRVDQWWGALDLLAQNRKVGRGVNATEERALRDHSENEMAASLGGAVPVQTAHN